ncbi:MAG: ABC transporter substrate-binding protein [Deltaproteobacteria bacterium]|nr:ABC transporter substrate-binding protein [Deltaproteobacteria bacterium]
MGRYFVGVDDTDFGESIGTGSLARELAIHLERSPGVRCRGVTRHQLFVHPDIPYSSHNSSACIEVESPDSLEAMGERASRFVTGLLHEGADPGVCVCHFAPSSPALIDFGRRARDTVLVKEEALGLCAREGAFVRELGGSGLGVIGAVAACGLRQSRDDGRFISLPGARELDGILSAREIADRLGLDAVVDETGVAVPPAGAVDTLGWVRPLLSGGRVLLRVVRDGVGTGWKVVINKPLDKH